MERVAYVLSALFVFGALPAAGIFACWVMQGLALALISSVLLLPAAVALWTSLRKAAGEPWSNRPGWTGVNLDI